MGKFKPNGFIIFANEYKKKHNLAYHSFRELLESVSPFWNELPDIQKEEYKELAKYRDRKSKLGKRNCPQNAYEFEEKKRKLENELDEKSKIVEDTVYSASDIGVLDDKIFILVNISTYFEDTNATYPAELGLAKFSLRQGIIDTLHIKINPGNLPIGANYPVLEKANKTHKYVVPSFNNSCDNDELGETSYILILMNIIEFLGPTDDNELPMFFTQGSSTSNELLSVQRSLATIFDYAGEYEIASDLKVYSLTDLIYYLNQVNDIGASDAIQKFPTMHHVDESIDLTTTLYQYICVGCSYHEYHDCANHCCLAKVKCYGYIIAKYCVNQLKYPLLEGHHFPMGYKLVN